MNVVCLQGYIAKDIEVVVTPNGAKVVKFTMAVKDDAKDKTGKYPTYYIPCEGWNTVAGYMERYCEKGQRICIHGKIKTGSYESKNTSRKIYYTLVVVDKVELALNTKEFNTAATLREEKIGNGIMDFVSVGNPADAAYDPGSVFQ